MKHKKNDDALPDVQHDGERPTLPAPEPLAVAVAEAAVKHALDNAPAKLQPHEWAAKLGHVHARDARIPQSVTHYSMAHAVADKLHGWSKHAHHYQDKPLLLTQADYEAALAAGGTYPTTPAHAPACSPVVKTAKGK